MLSRKIWPRYGKFVTAILVGVISLRLIPMLGDSNGRHAIAGGFAAMIGGPAASGPAPNAPPNPQTAVLQFFGKVTMTPQNVPAPGHLLKFDLATPALAATFLSKLHADMTWDDMLGPNSVTLDRGVPALKTAGSLLVLARRGAAVYTASGPTPAAVEQVLGEAGLRVTGVSFQIEPKIPSSLNFTDLQSLFMILHQFHRYSDDAIGLANFTRPVLEGPYKFWSQRGFSFGYNYRTNFGYHDLVDGAPETFPSKYEYAIARKFDAPFYSWFGPWLAPWWIRNEFPHDLNGIDPLGIPLWNPANAEAGTAIELCCASDKAVSYSTRDDVAMMQASQQAGRDSFSAIRFNSGWPGDEMGLHLFSTELTGFSDAAEQGLRQWLRTKGHLDLAQLGERWYGDPHHYTDWGQVIPPSQFSFFGDYGDESFDLLKGWRWRPDQPQAKSDGWWREDFQPGEDWAEVDLAPSKGQLFLFGSEIDKTGWRQGDSTVAWFRLSFDPRTWLATARQKGQQVYLVANTYSKQPVQVFFNGTDLGLLKSEGHAQGPIGIKVTELVKSGRNVLVMKVPSGMIPGPVFLTTHDLGFYPYADWHKNARWVDARDWLIERNISGYIRAVEPLVKANPDIPIMLNLGGSMATAENLLEMKRRIGMCVMYDTGAEVSFRPQWAALGYPLGAYGGSEESNTTPSPARMTEEMSGLMFNGESMHTFVFTSEHYQKMEEQSHWFTDHRRELAMFGKAVWAQPQVAILYSGHEVNYFPLTDMANQWRYQWDLGRGRLQRTHFNDVYLTEEGIQAGMADPYPVILDSNTRVLDAQTLDALERYVRQGGTFVALNLSGRHSSLHANTWAIQQLTGCKVLGERRGMKVRVVKDNPLLKQLAGMEFSGANPAQNPGAGGTPGDISFALAPDKGVDFKPIALWDDGTVAAGVRMLGKGRVVVLASTFWSETSDAAGAAYPEGLETAFLNDLLHGLGLVAPATSSDPEVWARSFNTKDGLQDWLMLLNSTDASKQGITLRFRWPHDPGTVYDAASGKPVTYAWRDGLTTVSGLTVGPHDIRVLAVDRGDFNSAVEHWFAIKTKFDVHLPDETLNAIPPPLPLPPAGMLQFDHFQFRQALADPSQDSGWVSEDDKKSPWRQVGEGFWDEMGYQAYGIGYYRQSFSLPPAWHGRRVLLTLASFSTPIFLQNAEFYCNGQEVGQYQAGMWASFSTFELTPCLHPGQNELGVRVQAEQIRGGYLGQVIIYPLHPLRQELELSQWALQRDPLKSRNVTLPIEQTPVRDLRTQIMVPADWTADKIFLRMEAKSRWISCVVVNGQPVSFNQSLHPFGEIAEMNLYPWIKPGQINTIELWATHSIPNGLGLTEGKLGDASLSRVVLGVAGPEGAASSPGVARK